MVTPEQLSAQALRTENHTSIRKRALFYTYRLCKRDLLYAASCRQLYMYLTTKTKAQYVTGLSTAHGGFFGRLPKFIGLF